MLRLSLLGRFLPPPISLDSSLHLGTQAPRAAALEFWHSAMSTLAWLVFLHTHLLSPNFPCWLFPPVWMGSQSERASWSLSFMQLSTCSLLAEGCWISSVVIGAQKTLSLMQHLPKYPQTAIFADCTYWPWHCPPFFWFFKTIIPPFSERMVGSRTWGGRGMYFIWTLVKLCCFFIFAKFFSFSLEENKELLSHCLFPHMGAHFLLVWFQLTGSCTQETKLFIIANLN